MPGRLERFLNRRDKRPIAAIAAALILIISITDYATGADVSLQVFYWIPLALVVWFFGLSPGLATGLACACIATMSDFLLARAFHNQAVGLASEIISRILSFSALCLLLDALRQRTRSLDLAASRLKAFDYSVAHDLRGPVRSITSFAQVISRSAGGMDEASRGYLKRIVAAGLRLSAMLEGLLLLSGVTARTISRETVDLSALARDAFNDLEAQAGAHLPELRVPESLAVLADRQLLIVLMHHLLQNACKFSAAKKAAVIEVGVDARQGAPVFFVRDNGMGFDPAYAGELFQPFRRLPNAAGFPGVGVGLAAAARAVEALGGRIWAEGKPGQGATFFFTLGSPS